MNGSIRSSLVLGASIALVIYAFQTFAHLIVAYVTPLINLISR